MKVNGVDELITILVLGIIAVVVIGGSYLWLSRERVEKYTEPVEKGWSATTLSSDASQNPDCRQTNPRHQHRTFYADVEHSRR